MFATVVLALFAASFASAAPLRATQQPRGYAQDADLLEPYTTYNTRYMAFGCENKHNTSFFDACCHPLLKAGLASKLPSICVATPAASTSAAAATSTVAPGDDGGDDDDDCDDDDDDDSSSAPASTVAAPKTTSVAAPAPEPTTTAAASSSAPAKPTHTHAPTTVAPTTAAPVTTAKPTTVHHTTKAAAPTTTAASSGGGGGSAKTGGFATYYLQGGNKGACGDAHGDDDLIIAINYTYYGDDSKKSDYCGKKIKITNTDNGKSVTATVADDCPSCEKPNSLDLSQGAFQQIAALSDGEVPISWVFV